MKIRNWFKSMSKLDDELTSMKEKGKETTTTLPCPANQHNTECDLVKQLRKKQNELKVLNNMYFFTINEYRTKMSSTTLCLQLLSMLNYPPFFRYIIHSNRNDNYYINSLKEEIFQHPMSDNEIDMCIDFFTQYKQMVQDIKDAPQKKEKLEKEISELKQRLGIE